MPGMGAAETVQRGPALLTVAGAITNSNRPAFDPHVDAFFGAHEQAFDKAFAFDRAALEALPQVALRATAEMWPATVAAKGPRLRDVLAAAGAAPDATVTLVALDGYAVVLDANARASATWVLAIDANGAPLGIGGRGPTWLLFDTGDAVAGENIEARWAWSVFLIEVAD